MGPILTVVRKSRLSDEVAHQLGAAIRKGEFVPGERLPSEKTLSERFAVSRMVIREAMSRLKSDALVETRQGLGAFVATEPGKGLFRLDTGHPEANDLRCIFQLRIAVESAAAGIAAITATEVEIDEMRQALSDLSYDIANERDGIEPDNRFHAIIARSSRNPYFDRFLAFIGANLRQAITHARLNTRSNHPDRIKLVQKEHEAVLSAISCHDAHAAETAMRAHLSNAMERLGLGPFASEQIR